MAKTLIYIVAAGILVLLGVDGYLAATARASAHTIIELAVGLGAILAFAVAAFIKTVSGSTSWGICWPRRGWKAEVAAKLDSLSQSRDSHCNRIGTLRDDVDELDSKFDDLSEKVESIADDSDGPDAWVATINTKDDNGKLVKVYDLPPEDTKEEAIEAARGSLMARECEGNPVADAVITLTGAYRV